MIVDLDDFCEENSRSELLQGLAEEITGFRVTLFTIPGRCSRDFLYRWLATPWVELVPHGWSHDSNYECRDWNADAMAACLHHCRDLGFRVRGFKAPGWQISEACYHVLREQGYWVADQSYNNFRRPAMDVYLLDSGNKVHGHVGHLGGHNSNELAALIPLLRKGSDFQFVSNNIIFKEQARA